MAATFPTISWLFEVESGNPQPVPGGVDVVAADETGSTLDTFTTDSDGRVVSASITGASAGDIVYFRIENYNGMAGSVGVRMG